MSDIKLCSHVLYPMYQYIASSFRSLYIYRLPGGPGGPGGGGAVAESPEKSGTHGKRKNNKKSPERAGWLLFSLKTVLCL